MKELADQLKTIVNMKEREVEKIEDLGKMAERTQSFEYFKDTKKEAMINRILPKCYSEFSFDNIQIKLMHEETLFYIFYSIPNSKIQIQTYNEIIGRGYYYSKLHESFIILKNMKVIDNQIKAIDIFNFKLWKKETINILFDSRFINNLEKEISTQ